MLEKVIVFGLFEMIPKKKGKKSEDRVPRSGFGLRAGSGMATWAITPIYYVRL